MMLTSVFIVYRDRYAIVYAPLVVVKVDLIASKYLIVGVFLVGYKDSQRCKILRNFNPLCVSLIELLLSCTIFIYSLIILI